MAIQHIGASTTQTNREDHQKENGAITIRLMDIQLKHAERVMAHHPHSTNQANFPANYDQATPAVQTTEPLDWWNEDAELSSVCLHSEPMDFNLTAFDDDELDEETANLLFRPPLYCNSPSERKT